MAELRLNGSGAGLVWGEATAVRPDGKANPNQLVLDDSTVDSMAELRSRLASDQVAVLQLTHSGRYSRPSAAGPAPRTAYEHRLLDARVGSGADEVLSDGELDELADQFVDRARLAHRAGFEFVDVKACHGYLGHELLSGVTRPGPYGGDLDGRSRFMRSVIERIRSEIPGLGVAVRLSIFDLVPHVPGDGGVGVPETDDLLQADETAVAGVEAPAHVVEAELRVRRAEADVAGERELEAPGHGEPVDRGDDRLEHVEVAGDAVQRPVPPRDIQKGVDHVRLEALA